LEGITRQLVIELAQKNGIEVKQQNVSLNLLYEAEEAFLTSTTKRILPVTRVAHKQIGDGKVGNLTKRLQNLFADMEANYLQENA
jgi:branched-subunit amino acid aminotransferase/4-amino-4-deoxychorismate lyase